jgi:hypothetical protein
MLRQGRDGKDNAKATEITDRCPGMPRGAPTGAREHPFQPEAFRRPMLDQTGGCPLPKKHGNIPL